jgi:hypothetical protein
MAPERLSAAYRLHSPVDVYAFGCVCYAVRAPWNLWCSLLTLVDMLWEGSMVSSSAAGKRSDTYSEEGTTKGAARSCARHVPLHRA